MIWLIIIAMIFVLPFIGKKMSSLFFKIDDTLKEKEDKHNSYMEELISTSREIAITLDPPLPQLDYAQALINSKEEIEERQRFKTAVEEELGIKIDD
jgi:hypothetical protein